MNLSLFRVGNVGYLLAVTEKQGVPEDSFFQKVALFFKLFLDHRSYHKEKSEEFLESIFQLLPQGILILDDRHHIVAANKMGKKLYEALTSKSLDDTVISLGPITLEELCQSSEKSTRLVMDGVSYRVKVYPNFLTLGNVSHTVILLEDITEEAKALEVKRKESQWQGYNRLVGGLAHKFNNLLMAISSNSELLAMEPLEYSQKEKVETIQKAVFQGAELIQQLLSVTGQSMLSLKVVYLQEWLGKQKEKLQSIIKEGVALVYKFEGQKPFPIKADEKALTSIFIHLLSNASQASKEDAEIEIHMREVLFSDRSPSRFVVVSVVDKGKGMPPEVLRRAEDPFFSTKDLAVKDGLGLAVVRGLMQQMGGWMEIQSEENVGTEVKLYFPIVEP